MAKSAKVLKITKDGTTYTCDLYTTTAETRGCSNPIKVGNTTLYMALLAVNHPEVENYGTPAHIQKYGSATEYRIAKKAMFKISITPVANETITVTAGGQRWTSGEKWFPYGTAWTATITGATGYNPGAITGGTSGTLTNADVSISAKPATLKKFILKLAATTGQTITLRYTRPGGSTVTVTSGGTDRNHTVEYGTTWIATLQANAGYTAGSLPAYSGTVTSDTVVYATTANSITPRIYFSGSGQNLNFVVTYTNPQGQIVTTGKNPSSITIKYGTAVTVKNNNVDTYDPNNPYGDNYYDSGGSGGEGSGGEGNSW